MLLLMMAIRLGLWVESFECVITRTGQRHQTPPTASLTSLCLRTACSDAVSGARSTGFLATSLQFTTDACAIASPKHKATRSHCKHSNTIRQNAQGQNRDTLRAKAKPFEEEGKHRPMEICFSRCRCRLAREGDWRQISHFRLLTIASQRSDLRACGE